APSRTAPGCRAAAGRWCPAAPVILATSPGRGASPAPAGAVRSPAPGRAGGWRVGRGRDRSARTSSTCQVGAEHPFALRDAGNVDVLLTGVCDVRITGAEVDRGDAEVREPRDVGPAELRDRLAADGGDEVGGRRLAEPR